MLPVALEHGAFFQNLILALQGDGLKILVPKVLMVCRLLDCSGLDSQEGKCVQLIILTQEYRVNLILVQFPCT